MTVSIYSLNFFSPPILMHLIFSSNCWRYTLSSDGTLSLATDLRAVPRRFLRSLGQDESSQDHLQVCEEQGQGPVTGENVEGSGVHWIIVLVQ